MELTIKHLAAYLPYRLKGLKISKGNFKTDPNIEEIIDLTISDIGVFLKKRYHVISCKPILRPLSMLDKEIEVNGERFIPIMVLFGGENYREYDFTIEVVEKPILGKRIEISVKDLGSPCISFGLKNVKANSLTFENWQLLLSWHFDIFGLIDAGLAVEMEDSHGR
jgi:hypothetical protein